MKQNRIFTIIFFIFILSIIFIPSIVSGEIIFNEIMYNPSQCSDNYCEWIELYNGGLSSVNLSDWKLCSKPLFSGAIIHNSGNLILDNPGIIPPKSYAMITDGNSGTDVYDYFNVSNNSLAFHVGAASLCNGLTDSSKTIILTDGNGATIDSVNYFDFWGADGNNHSLELIGGGIFKESNKSFGTPGYKNSIMTSTNKSDNKTNDTTRMGRINGTIPKNDSPKFSSCDWEIILKTNNSIFREDKFEFFLSIKRLIGLKENLTVRGEILNINEKIVKKYSSFTKTEIVNERNKHYSPNLWPGIYQLKFRIENITCNDSNLNNNQVDKLILIKSNGNSSNDETLPSNESLFLIEKIYLGKDNSAKWGEQVRVKLNLYKGKTRKTSVEIWAEFNNKTISKKTKVNLNDQLHNYHLTLPVQLNPNCNDKFENGTATFRLKGLDLEEKTTFQIEGFDSSLCQKQYVDKEKMSSFSLRESFKIINSPKLLFSGKIQNFTLEIFPGKESHRYLVWAYLYRGNTCYSCKNQTLSRNSTLWDLNSDNNKTTQLNLSINIDELIPGEYKLKVKILKDDLKTAKELTYDLVVIKPIGSMENNENMIENKNSSQSDYNKSGDNLGNNLFGFDNKDNENNFDINPNQGNLLTGAFSHVVYLSPLEKAKELAPLVLLVAIFGLFFLMFFRK
jgi:hypothetical protein